MGKEHTAWLEYSCIFFNRRRFLLVREHGEHSLVNNDIKAIIGVGEICSVSLFHCYILLDVVSRDVFLCLREYICIEVNCGYVAVESLY